MLSAVPSLQMECIYLKMERIHLKSTKGILTKEEGHSTASPWMLRSGICMQQTKSCRYLTREHPSRPEYKVGASWQTLMAGAEVSTVKLETANWRMAPALPPGARAMKV